MTETQAETTDLAAAALEYARQGFHVFPCHPGDKEPIPTGGYKAATADVDQVAAWWRDNPEANIGVWPGPSGLIALNIVQQGKVDGEKTLARLLRKYQKLPANVPKLRDPAGGYQIWVAVPEKFGPPPGRPAGKGVEVCSAEGHVLLPPSRTKDGVYETREEALPLTWPGDVPEVGELWMYYAFATGTPPKVGKAPGTAAPAPAEPAAPAPAEPAATNLATAALEYARQGFHVFPLRPGGKDPLVTGGFKAATCDLNQVAEWWTANPHANIGVWPGGSRNIVLDIDVKKEAGGPASLDHLVLMYGALPDDTPVIETPSGGWHLWLSAQEGKALPGNKPAAPGVDVRSANGYVILSPSCTEAGSYQARAGAPDLNKPEDAPTMPEAWAEAVLHPASAKPKRESSDQDTEIELDDPLDIERAEAYAAEAPEAVEGDQGSQQTFEVACVMRDMGLSEDETFRIMEEIYNPRCEPEWDPDPGAAGPEALASRVSSAYRNAQEPEPGTISARHVVQDFAKYASPIEGTAAPANQNKKKRDSFKVRRGNAIMEMQPPGWLMKSVLPRGGVVALYGPPGSKKSFLVIDWLFHLAYGLDWQGYRIKRPQNVMYVDGEGWANIKKRVVAWKMQNGKDPWGEEPSTFGHLDDFPEISEKSDWDSWVTELKQEAAETPIDLVVFDTFAMLTSGMEENDNGAMSKVLRDLRKLRDDLAEIQGGLRPTILLVHHTTKTGGGSHGGDVMRGAGALAGGLDAMFFLEGAGGYSAKLTCKKQKDGDLVPADLVIEFASHIVFQDEDGEDETSLAVRAGLEDNSPTPREKKEIEAMGERKEAVEREEAVNEGPTSEEMGIPEEHRPSAEVTRPLYDRVKEVLIEDFGGQNYEAAVDQIASALVDREEMGGKQGSGRSALKKARREDLQKATRPKGEKCDPKLVRLVIDRKEGSPKNRNKDATRLRLPPAAPER